MMEFFAKIFNSQSRYLFPQKSSMMFDCVLDMLLETDLLINEEKNSAWIAILI